MVFARAVLFSIPLVLIGGSVLADEENSDWLKIDFTDQQEWYGKKGSGSIANLGEKKNNAYSYVIQISNKKDKTHKYSKVFVELASCKKGYGYVYYNTMDGEFTGKDRFVRFGGTIADSLGSMACHSWDLATGKTSLANNGNAWEVVAVAATTGNKHSIQNNSVRKINYNNKPAVSALYSYFNVAKNTTDYSEYVISLSDCKRGYGVAYELDFDGKLRHKSDIALSGDSVLSATISAVCGKYN